MTTDWVLREAVVADADAACQVLKRSIVECCALDHHRDPTRIATWIANKTSENVSAWIAHPGVYALIAESASKPVGVGMITRSGQVTLCYLVPEALYKGIGRALLNAMLDRAQHWGLRTVHLESTQTALAFYARNGFKPDGAPFNENGLIGTPMSRDIEGSRYH